MFDVLFWILIGVLIGWNLPQPTWAVYLQNKLTEIVQNIFHKVNNDNN